jgi:hypothetical protein
VERVPLEVKPREENLRLQTKRSKLGHLLNNV